jgi:ribosomal silencing factor RsfS
MNKQIVLVNYNLKDYNVISNMVMEHGISCNSIDGSLDIKFNQAFKQEKNIFKDSKDKFILFNELDNDQITDIYKKIKELVKDEIILVKLMDNNSQMKLAELLIEVSKEDELMRRYYHLETLFKAINIIDPSIFDEADRLKIMSAYSVYKNDTYQLEDINNSIKMMEELIKSKSDL